MFSSSNYSNMSTETNYTLHTYTQTSHQVRSPNSNSRLNVRSNLQMNMRAINVTTHLQFVVFVVSEVKVFVVVIVVVIVAATSVTATATRLVNLGHNRVGDAF